VVYVGLEAMVGSRLDKYKKRTSVDTNRKAIELLKEIASRCTRASWSIRTSRSRTSGTLKRRSRRSVRRGHLHGVSRLHPGPSSGIRIRTTILSTPISTMTACTRSCDEAGHEPLLRALRQAVTGGASGESSEGQQGQSPFRETVKIIYLGTRYIFAMRNIYKDYLPKKRA